MRTHFHVWVRDRMFPVLAAVMACCTVGSVVAQNGVSANTRIPLEFPVQKLSLSIPGTVTISDKADAGVMELSAPPGTLERVKITQKKGSLTIESIDGKGIENPVTVKLASRVLSELAVAGSAGITCDSMAADKSGTTSVNLAGSSQITIKSLRVKNARITIAGSGSVTLESGTADTLNVGISGSGNLDSTALKAVTAQVGVSGSGKAKVFATDVMKAGISGSGSIEIHGKPASVSKSVSGTGRITEK